MLEEFYNFTHGLRIQEQEKWYLQNSLDYFPGYYFFNCMTQLIARKNEVERVSLDLLETRTVQYPMENIKHRTSDFIGKDYYIWSLDQPITDRYEETLLQYKLMLESTVKLDQYILNAGHKAIYFYKQRSQILRGSGNLSNRTVMMINFHLSELLRNQANPLKHT